MLKGPYSHRIKTKSVQFMSMGPQDTIQDKSVVVYGHGFRQNGFRQKGLW
jgi:hypothetical protein